MSISKTKGNRLAKLLSFGFSRLPFSLLLPWLTQPTTAPQNPFLSARSLWTQRLLLSIIIFISVHYWSGGNV